MRQNAYRRPVHQHHHELPPRSTMETMGMTSHQAYHSADNSHAGGLWTADGPFFGLFSISRLGRCGPKHIRHPFGSGTERATAYPLTSAGSMPGTGARLGPGTRVRLAGRLPAQAWAGELWYLGAAAGFFLPAPRDLLCPSDRCLAQHSKP